MLRKLDNILEVVNPDEITTQGFLGDDWTDGSHTVTITMVIYWDTITVNNIKHDRITSISYTPNLLDNRFTMKRIDADVGYVGSGYRNGQPVVYDSESKSFYTNNPVSGKTYSHNTGFTLYVNRGENQASGGALNLSIKLQRVDTGKTTTLNAEPLVWF